MNDEERNCDLCGVNNIDADPKHDVTHARALSELTKALKARFPLAPEELIEHHIQQRYGQQQ